LDDLPFLWFSVLVFGGLFDQLPREVELAPPGHDDQDRCAGLQPLPRAGQIPLPGFLEIEFRIFDYRLLRVRVVDDD
jgi:hypothetical protein